MRKVYSIGSDLLSALSTVRTRRVCVPSLGGATDIAFAPPAPPVATLVQVTPSRDHSSQLWSAAGGVTLNVPACPAPLTQALDG